MQQLIIRPLLTLVILDQQSGSVAGTSAAHIILFLIFVQHWRILTSSFIFAYHNYRNHLLKN